MTLTADKNLQAYERGVQASFFSAIAAAFTQVGNAKPTTGVGYALPPVVARGQLPFNFVVQVDLDLSGASTVTAWTIDILGSLDGEIWYVLTTISGTSNGGIFPVAGAPVRFIAAQPSTFTIGANTPKIAASFSM